MNSISKITIIGGGNVGTQFACICASKGYAVTVYSSKPDSYCGVLNIIDKNDHVVCEGKLKKVTNSMEEAMDADMIFVVHPAYMFLKLASLMEQYIKPGMLICSVPGTGGAEFAFRRCMDRGAILLGLQRVPAIARLVEYGRTVRVEGKREALYLASIPAAYTIEMVGFMSELFDMPCYPLPNYFSVTMTPSNPILHTSRLATMFEDYSDGKVYSRNPLFYGEWSDASSQRLLECDAEHQHMLQMLDQMDLRDVKSLVLHYDNSDTAEKMTKKISSISSLHNLLSPMKKIDGGYVPDFSSRYFSADFPYGLAIIEEIADIIGANAKKIKETMQWYRRVTGNNKRLELSQYGLKTKQDIYAYYK